MLHLLEIFYSGLLSHYELDISQQRVPVPPLLAGDSVTYNVSMTEILKQINPLVASRYRIGDSVGPFYVRVASPLFDVRSNNFTTRTCCISGCKCEAASAVCHAGLACIGELCCVAGYHGCTCAKSNACVDGSVCGGSDRVCMNRTECTTTSRLGDVCATDNTFSASPPDSGTSPLTCVGGQCQCSAKFSTQRADAACGPRDTTMLLAFQLSVSLGVPSTTIDAACRVIANRQACVRTVVVAACADFEVAGFCSNVILVDKLQKVNCTILCDKFVSPIATSGQRLTLSSPGAITSTTAGASADGTTTTNSLPSAAKSDSEQPSWIYAAVGGGAGGGLVLIIAGVVVAVCLCKKHSGETSKTAVAATTSTIIFIYCTSMCGFMFSFSNNTNYQSVDQRTSEENSFARDMASARDERTVTAASICGLRQNNIGVSNLRLTVTFNDQQRRRAHKLLTSMLQCHLQVSVYYLFVHK